MDRIIVILDQLRNRYYLVSGGNQAQIEIDRKISNPKKGFSLLLDREMPLVQTEILNIGPDAELIFNIRCNRTGEWTINYDEYEWLDKIFTTGSNILKKNIEKVSSRIKSSLVSSNRDPFMVYSLLEAVFPNIMEFVDDQLNELEDSFPYIRMEAHATINISNKLNEILDKTQGLIGEAWLKTATDPLVSPYEPEDEYQQRMKNFERARKLLPIPDPPSEEDIQLAAEIIRKEKLYYSKQKRFGILGDWPKLTAGN